MLSKKEIVALSEKNFTKARRGLATTEDAIAAWIFSEAWFLNHAKHDKEFDFVKSNEDIFESIELDTHYFCKLIRRRKKWKKRYKIAEKLLNYVKSI